MLVFRRCLFIPRSPILVTINRLYTNTCAQVQENIMAPAWCFDWLPAVWFSPAAKLDETGDGTTVAGNVFQNDPRHVFRTKTPTPSPSLMCRTWHLAVGMVLHNRTGRGGEEASQFLPSCKNCEGKQFNMTIPEASHKQFLTRHDVCPTNMFNGQS